MTERTPMPMCPMAGACKTMMEKRGSGFTMLIPGIVLILLGIAVIIMPQILAWLIALALIMMGVAMLVVATFMRRIGKTIRAN